MGDWWGRAPETRSGVGRLTGFWASVSPGGKGESERPVSTADSSPIGLQARSSADASTRRSGPSPAEDVTLASSLRPQPQFPLKLGMLEPQGSERLQRPAKSSGPVGCIL